MRESFKLDRGKAALLVIDMQRHFCDRKGVAYVPGSAGLIKRIKKLVEIFVAHDRPIIYTRHIDSDDKNNLMLRWWDGQIKEADAMSHIIEDFDTKNGLVIIKHQYDAFFKTNLLNVLQHRNIKQVVVSGVLTNICCETTARSAFMRGFEVYFLIDGTATYKKSMQNASLLNLSYGFAIPVTVDEIIRLFGK